MMRGRPNMLYGGFVRVDGHLDVVLLAHGHDGLEEVDEVLAQLLLIHVLVGVEQLFTCARRSGSQPGSVKSPEPSATVSMISCGSSGMFAFTNASVEEPSGSL